HSSIWSLESRRGNRGETDDRCASDFGAQVIVGRISSRRYPPGGDLERNRGAVKWIGCDFEAPDVDQPGGVSFARLRLLPTVAIHQGPEVAHAHEFVFGDESIEREPFTREEV